MKIGEMVTKWKLELGTKPDGTEGIKTTKKLTPKQIEAVKTNKDEIVAEIKRQKEEEKTRREAQRKQWKEEQKRAEEEYMKTADIRRYLVMYQDEYGKIEWSIQTLEFADGRVYQLEHGRPGYKELAHVTNTMDAIALVKEKEGAEFGIGGVAWEITEEQEKTILAEQEEAKKEADKKAAEERVKKEAAQKAAEAKEEAETRAREEYRATMKMEIIKKEHAYGGESKDPYAKVRITDVKTGESGIFTCRNIFDFGYVVNPEAGGILVGDKWNMTNQEREATDFEIKAVKYLYEFPPINTEIRM
jgi:hypothetical protein